MSLHSIDYFCCCAVVFLCNITTFVSIYFYFQSYWNTIQKVMSILLSWTMFSSGSFNMSDLSLMSLFHFELIFAQEIGTYFQFSTCAYPVIPVPLVKEFIFSLIYIFRNFVSNQMAIAAWDCFWSFYSIPVPFCFSCYGSIE